MAASASSYTSVYSSASVARASHVADTATLPDETGAVLAFATHRRVALCYARTSQQTSEKSLVIHTFLDTLPSPITCLKFTRAVNDDDDALLLSAATADGRLAAWRSSSKEREEVSWTLVGVTDTQGEVGRVRALAVQRTHQQSSSGGGTPVVTAHADGALRIWSISSTSVEQTQQLQLDADPKKSAKRGAMPLDAALVILDDGASILAVATTDFKVTLWGAVRGESFVALCSLTGHTDWVRSLDFTFANASTLLLASASQDSTVRIWRFTRSSKQDGGAAAFASKNQVDAFDVLAQSIEGKVKSRAQDLVTSAQPFQLNDETWEVRLDALLAGHDGWVTSVRWAPNVEAGNEEGIAALLSSASDNSAILWAPASALTAAPGDALPLFKNVERERAEPETWMPLHRFGDLGNQGMVALGLLGALWFAVEAKDVGKTVLAHGWNGALRMWSVDDNKRWEGKPTVTGHFAGVGSARWEPEGRYLVTGSDDKTTRIHGRCRARESSSWHEIARPQTHGHAVHCVGWLDALTLASAAEEKVLRIFEAPRGFVESTIELGAVDVPANPEEGDVAATVQQTQSEKKYDLLAFNLPTLEHVRSPGHLRSPIRHAAQVASTEAPFQPRRLVILACSPLFDGIHTGEALGVGFEDAERLLKWCYAQAWEWAVENKTLDLQVDVLLCGLDYAPGVVKRLASGEAGAERFWSVKETSAILPFLFAQRPRIGALAPESLRPSYAALSKPAPASEEASESSSIPQHGTVALGGTFDHLHVGHKILLSMACLLAKRRIIVGVTDDGMLAKKKHAEMLEDLPTRIARVDDFIRTFRSTMTPLKQEIVQLSDVCGPAGTDADVQALIVTDETIAGADMIKAERSKNGLGEVERFVIGVIGASGETDVKGDDAAALAASKIGSTAIRGWLAEKRKKATMDKSAAIKAVYGDLAIRSRGIGDPQRPVGAVIPPLGLSNRALYLADEETTSVVGESGQNVGTETKTVAEVLSRPPTEDELNSATIWAEIHKLYGHPSETTALDVCREGRLIASSCQAKSEEHAAVRIHDAGDSWRGIAKLEGHSLGVTRLRFSPVDTLLLLSVSRDRTWRLWKAEAQTDGKKTWSLLATEPKAHARIVWDASWTLDGKTFATCSRDKSVKVWSLATDGKVTLTSTLKMTEPCTAVAYGKDDVLAVGLESGNVLVYREGLSAAPITLMEHHTESIGELAWQPLAASSQDSPLLLSGSEDGSVRLVKLS